MEAESGQRGKEGTSHFVLVHGACHGAWCWYKLSTLLRKAGHVVTAVDLGGAGFDRKDGDEIRSLVEYNQPLAEVMKTLSQEEGDEAEMKGKVIMVGHSMGGVNLTCMMEEFPHKIAAAVFLTAFMPVPGTTPLHLIDQLQLAENYKDIFYQIQRQLQSKQPALYLFKNIVRIGSKGSQMLRSASSTFVDVLNDDYAIAELLPFTTKTETQLQGLLKAKNVYSPPFQQFCDKCKQPLPLFSDECIDCKENTICKFQHHVECTLETDDGIIECAANATAPTNLSRNCSAYL